MAPAAIWKRHITNIGRMASKCCWRTVAWSARRKFRQRNRLARPSPVQRILKAEDVVATLQKGGSAKRDEAGAGPAKFNAGDRVIARNINPPTHTRVPRYVRGRAGVIDRVHGVFVFPDTNAKSAMKSHNGSTPCGLKARSFGGQMRRPAHASMSIFGTITLTRPDPAVLRNGLPAERPFSPPPGKRKPSPWRLS